MQQNPKAIYRKNAQVLRSQQKPEAPFSILEGLTPEQSEAYKALSGEERRAMTAKLRADRDKEMVKKMQAYRASLKYETVDITWEERAENLKDYLFGELQMDDQANQQRMTMEQAIAIQERLPNEIPAEGFLEMGKEMNFSYVSKYEDELKAGDLLLIK